VKIVVTHLTRMKPGFVCVAGVDLATRKAVRPELPRGRQLGTDLLHRNGGPFGIASVVDLGEVCYAGDPPRIEDHLFDPLAAKRIGIASRESYWRLLESSAKTSLRSTFGDALDEDGSHRTVALGAGIASLGCFRPPVTPTLAVTQNNRLRLYVPDGGRYMADLSVADLRFYEADHQTIRRHVVEQVVGRIKRGVSLLLSVGLTHPFPPENPRHWLQVNNIHLADDPTWSGDG
jgi:hypothetical protein